MKAQPGSSIEPRDPEPRTGDSQATKRMAALSPRTKARMAGGFQFLEGLTSPFGQVVVLGRLVVGNAATTAAGTRSVRIIECDSGQVGAHLSAQPRADRAQETPNRNASGWQRAPAS